MKLIGLLVDSRPWVAVLTEGEDAAIPLATVEDFWSDPAGWCGRELPSEVSPLLRGTVTEVPLVPQSARILCIGLNYRAHAAEGSFPEPEYPTIFGRWYSSLSVGEVPVPLPDGEEGLDWEGEVAAFIGTPVRGVDEAEAVSAIFGYSTFNDLTARRAQKLTAQWTLGKNADLSGPMGPLVTADEVGSLHDGLTVRTRVNGTEVQSGNTRDMIFSIESIIALVSKTMTLNPGDVIVSGTPEGVGYVRTPPWYLQSGDVVEVEIDKLGLLRTPIGPERAR